MQGDRAKQLALEEEADASAAANKLAELRQAAKDGDAELPRASRLIARMYAVVEESLRAQANTVTRGTGGKYKSWLRALPLDVAAVIAMRNCIQWCSASTYSRPVLLQDLAGSLGKLWELEVRIREAEQVNPLYMRRIHEQVKDSGTRSESHLRRLYNTAYERVMKGELDSALPKADLMHIGKFGVQACMDAGLIESHRTTAKSGVLVYFTLTPEVHEFLTGYGERDVQFLTDHMCGAMTCPPDDWGNLTDGGYLSARRRVAYPLMNLHSIRASERAALRASFTADNMPEVFECANYLQRQAFAVHEPTLRAIQRIWESGGGVLGVPTRAAPQKPVCPLPEEWVKDGATDAELAVFSKWKRDAVQHYETMRAWRGKVREIGGFLKTTEKCDGPVWFPVYMDRRNRWYYRGAPNPQGSDLAKGVLHFHEKKALGEDGVFWLKVHIANSYGFDKDRFIDRARWTEQHWAEIERALDEPENHTDVFGTDAPWCMFSAAWELREAYRSGNPRTYRTGQIVHMDATCSGLQHFAAILRDPTGGLYVNLTDPVGSGPKQDIYARVAGNALEAIKRDLEGDDPELKSMAAWWLRVGIPRALAKKPVMTYVYGATLLGTAQHIENYVEQELKIKWDAPENSLRYSQYAARKLFQGIAATVPAAENAMRWLREVARSQPKGKRMVWNTPAGFPVQHDYVTYDERRIAIHSCGMSRLLVKVPTDGTNPHKMQNAIAPNFVHALDATHLIFTARRMRGRGLSMVAIHDSYGTHACDVAGLHKELREAFVELYQHRNILGEFLWDVGGVGEPPMRGALDISEVLNSEFFFC